MAVKGQNFKLWAGNDREIEFSVEGFTNFIGVEFKWAASRTPNGTPLIEKNSIAGDITIDDNVVTVSIDKEDTAGLSGGRYYHELWSEDASGNISTLAKGYFRLYKSLVVI